MKRKGHKVVLKGQPMPKMKPGETIYLGDQKPDGVVEIYGGITVSKHAESKPKGRVASFLAKVEK